MSRIRRMLTFALICFLMPYVVSCTKMDDQALEVDYDSYVTVKDDSGASDGSFANSDVATFVPHYIKPTVPFSLYEGESTREVFYYGADVAGLQAMIDEAQAGNANDMLVVRLRSELKVEDAPLVLSSRTALCFETKEAKIVAGENITATELVRIQDAQFVGIMRGVGTTPKYLFDGGDKVASAIKIVKSGKIIIENIGVANVKENGINAQGVGNFELVNIISVVESTFTNCKGAGIYIRESANPILSNNTLTKCGKGIDVISTSAVIQCNDCRDNVVGISYDTPSATVEPAGLVSRNTVEDNSTGIFLGDMNERAMVTKNIVKNNGVGMVAGGQRNRIFANKMDNATEFGVSGISKGWNHVVRNDGAGIAEKGGSRSVNPPTIKNPHMDQIRENKERVDMTIDNSANAEAMNMTEVQKKYDDFRAANSGKDIVLWMKGEFVAKDVPIALKLYANTYVVLDGTIYADVPEGVATVNAPMYCNYYDHYVPVPIGYDKDGEYNSKFNTPNTVMIYMVEGGKNTCISFSGGVIDCRSLPSWGIFTPKSNNDGTVLLDNVTVKSAVYGNIATLNHAEAEAPVFIHECTVDGTYVGEEGFTNTFRGIWIHMNKYIYCVGNNMSNHEGDAFDVDAHGHCSMVLYNNTLDEIRFGVFIEEEASDNVVVGNLFRESTPGITMAGLGMYSSEEAGRKTCKRNVLAFNTATNDVGIIIRYAENTISFNNRVRDAARYGVYFDVENNYSSQIQMKDELRWEGDFDKNYFFSLPR